MYSTLYVLQLFMCAMWLVLQLVVVLLYWDVPPLDSVPEMHTALQRLKEEEERPLVCSRAEDGTPGSGSYTMVLSDETETQLSDELGPSEAGATPSEAGATPSSDSPRSTDDPFEDFSASQGAFRAVVVMY